MWILKSWNLELKLFVLAIKTCQSGLPTFMGRKLITNKLFHLLIVSLANLYSRLWQTLCFVLDTATTVSDSEAKTHARRPRRRTTGGSETGQEIEKAKRLHAQGNGNSSEPDNQAAQTLSRQQIIAMVKKRFGLKPGEQNGNKPNGIQDVPPVRLFHLLKVISQPP